MRTAIQELIIPWDPMHRRLPCHLSILRALGLDLRASPIDLMDPEEAQSFTRGTLPPPPLL